jgi:hypothetical protein
MTYEEWQRQVPDEIRDDPLWKMEAYRRALFLHDLAWEDCAQMLKDRRGRAIAEQLIRSAGSISANIEEGYGRGFGKPFALFLRYSLAPHARREVGITEDADSSPQRSYNTATVC